MRVAKYLELTKPKVTLLNLCVGVTCFVLAQFPKVNFTLMCFFVLAGYLTVGGCGALNCYYDRDIDKSMKRTLKRAVPAGHVSPARSFLFGAILIVSGLAMTYAVFGLITLSLMMLGIVFYVFVYTLWLKRRTHWNVVIGGLAGTFAALSGWTATGNALALLPLLVGALDFLWTPGHLWGLAIKTKKEYEEASVPMLPVTLGLERTSRVILYLNLVTILFSFLIPLFRLAGLTYLFIAASAGLILYNESRKLNILPSETQAFNVFKASTPYLAIIMMALIADRIFPVAIF